MSKSKGNVLYADDLASVFGVDAVRYFVLHEMPFDQDGTITWELVCERVNSDLANVLGNLVKRTVSMTNQYLGGVARDCGEYEEADESLKSVVTSARDSASASMDNFCIADALDKVWAIFRRANKYIDETTPWILAKDEGKFGRLSTVLYNLCEAISVGAHLMQPFMPDAAARILGETGAESRSWDSLVTFGAQAEYRVAEQPQTLFARIKFDDVKPQIEKIMEAQRSKAAPAPQEEKAEPITIDDFAKVRMVVGEVVACEPVKKSKLLHETVDIGGRTISVLSGIAKHYTAEEMVGKKVIVVTNLPPREMKGLMSEGMIVCAEAPDGTLSIVSPEKDVPAGSVLS